MRVSLFKKVYTFALISSIILAILVASILWSYQKVNLAYSRDDYAQKVSSNASALRLLIRHGDIFSAQYNNTDWFKTQKELQQLLVSSPELIAKQKTIQNSIKSQNESVKHLFEQIVSNKNHVRNESIRQHLQEKIITLLDIIRADAKQLSAIAHKDINYVVKQQVIFILIVLNLSIICLLWAATKLINIFKVSHNEIKNAFKDNCCGKLKEIELSNHFEEFDDIANEFNKMLHKLNDASVALAERTELLEQLSNTDPLTKVSNRRYLFKRGEIEFSRAMRTKSPLAVLMLDCDYFKKINDKYGHLFGDEVLKHICQICSNEIRDIDCLARFGGEEFVVVLPDCDLDEAAMFAKKIHKSIAQECILFEGEKVYITVSIGVSQLDSKHNSFDQLIDCADHAMYMAKEKGRNCIEVAKMLPVTSE